jgi:hypothetical protein
MKKSIIVLILLLISIPCYSTIFDVVRMVHPIKAEDGETFETAFPVGDETWTINQFGATATYYVKASADDGLAYYSGSAWTMAINGNAVWAGYNTTTQYKCGSYYRFPNVLIPQGANILSAVFRTTAYNNYTTTTVNSKLTGELTTDAAQWSDLANFQARRGTIVGGANNNNITAAQVSWNGITSWSKDEEVSSPSIVSIIQEIVNQGGWSSGNDIGLFWDDYNDGSTHTTGTFRAGYSYDGTATEAKRSNLYVTALDMALIAKSNTWAKTGTYSLAITGTDGVSDQGAYFSPSVTTFYGGCVEADVRITALGTDKKTQVLWLAASTSAYDVATVVDVSGTKYWRLSNNIETSTATTVQASLNTDYHIQIVNYYCQGGGGQSASVLFVDGVLADYSIAHGYEFAVGYVGIGYLTGGASCCGGTRYIDNVKYQNGASIYPSICRGGAGYNTLLMSYCVTDAHNYNRPDSFVRVFKSTDNGATWSFLYDIATAGTCYRGAHIRWNKYTNSFWFFCNKRLYSEIADFYPYSDVWEMSDWTTPTVTKRSDWMNQTPTGGVAYTPTTFTNETTACGNATTNDMTLMSAAGSANDAYYFQAAFPFTQVAVNIGTNGAGTWTTTWEYWDGASWSALTTAADTIASWKGGTGVKKYVFKIPTNWVKTNDSGNLPQTAYTVRARCSAFTSLTTQPKGTQAWLSKNGYIYSSRIDRASGRVVCGMVYYYGSPPTDADDNYITSLDYDCLDYGIYNEQYLANYAEMAAGYSVDEPMFWRDGSENLCAMIRHTAMPTGTPVVERYKVSADDGASSWLALTQYDPGDDLEYLCAMLRAFKYFGKLYWQGRYSYSPGFGNKTVVMQTLANPEADHTIPAIATQTWQLDPSQYDEAGNGDIDAKSNASGKLYLDYVSIVYATSMYMYLDADQFISTGGIFMGATP